MMLIFFLFANLISVSYRYAVFAGDLQDFLENLNEWLILKASLNESSFYIGERKNGVIFDIIAIGMQDGKS